jgi:LCP family protein required for cell wall assembly
VTPPASPGDFGLPVDAVPARRRWLRRIGIVLIVSLAVLLGAVAAVLLVAKHEIDDLVTPKTAEMRAAQKQLTAPLPNTPTNIMLLGSDHRKTNGDEDKRSDTLLLVRLDPKRKTISMISFPRDLYVEIPGHGESKLNDAYYYGGPELSVKTVKQMTGLDINMVMNVDFDGFRGVVNQLGGVWVDVDRTYFNNTPDQTSDIDLKPGYQLLRGEQALQFSRFRHDNRGDFNRIARQQQVLAGLKKQVGDSSLAKNVPGLFRVFKKNTEVVAGGGDSVDARVLYDYLRLALTLDHKDVYEIEYDGETGEAAIGASIVVFDQDKMDEAVEAFLAPNSKARDSSVDQLVGKQQKAEAPEGSKEAADAEEQSKEPDAPSPSTVSVKVLNGSGVGGAAGKMAASLGSAGYRVDPAQSNADSANYASTKVFYSSEDAIPAARALADGIEGATIGPKDGSNVFTTQLLVVVGRTGTTFDAAGADGTVGTDGGPDGGSTYEGNVVPEKANAAVTEDLESAREQFFEVSLKNLPVMIPAMREESSSYEEAYAYEFARGEKGSKTVYEAYRLVAQTAAGDYWGLQGMTWHSPPILDGPTREVTRKGRTYRLYFNGTKLHMVAWRQGAGTYWVSNSVLNNLSNETMLAIAESARVMR